MVEPGSTQGVGNAARVGVETMSRWSGKLKDVAGSVLKDEKLRAQGRLQQEEAESRHRARVAEADAAQREEAIRRAEAGAESEYERDEERARRAEVTAEALRQEAHRLEEG